MPTNAAVNVAAYRQIFIVNVNEQGQMTLPVKIQQMLHMQSEPSMVQLSVQAVGRLHFIFKTGKFAPIVLIFLFLL